MSVLGQNYAIAPFLLAIFSSLIVVGSLLFSPIDSSHAQTTQNSAPVFEHFRAAFNVDENTPVGGAIGDPLVATDPDGDSLYFALVNGHTDLFSIDSGTGQLRTRASLDYETKPEEDYWLHVAVRDGKGPGGWVDLVADDVGLIVIEVENADDPGTVTLNWQRPEVGAELTATLEDPDGDTSGTSWRWAKASRKNGAFISIDGATQESYTPVNEDVDQYLRATVNYADPQGSGKTAHSATTGPVRRAPTPADNNAPVFSEGDSASRSITENAPPGTNIGSPVRATNTDNQELRYSMAGLSASHFGIKRSDGQIVTKEALDYEEETSYTVQVKVADPFGDSDTISLTINLVDVPVEILGPSRVEFSENPYRSLNPVGKYTIEPNSAALMLTGPDARHFSIAAYAGLTFNEEPDYEAPRDSGRNNVYNVTINATAAIGGTTHSARHDVQVAVSDYNEAPRLSGPVAVEFTEQTTGPVARYTATDPEGDPIRWEVQDTDDWTYFQISQSGVLSFREPPDYETRTKDTYEVVILARSGMNAATEGERVQVTVTDNPVDPPLFAASYLTPLEVSENAARDTPIGNPVSASDVNGLALIYTIRGNYARYFAIDPANGQLKTRSALNYETKHSYSVTVRASNGSLASDATVTINVINEDEAGTISYSPTTPKARIPLTASLTDPDGSVTGELWAWELSSDGNSWSTISGATSATYTPSDDDLNQYLRASVSYSDGQGSGKSAKGQSAGAVANGPNRSPSLLNTGTTITRTVAENTAADTEIGAPVTTSDPDGDTLTYALVGRDASAFSIVAVSGQLKTSAALNYEGKSSYTVVVRARDPSNTYVNLTVNISVTDVDEDGTAALSTSQPRVGIAVTASLNDPDGGRSNTSWQWKTAKNAAGAGEDISGATGGSYTPVAGDQGKYLWATITYDDIHGVGKSATSSRFEVGAARVPSNNGGGNDNPDNNGGEDLNQPPDGNPNKVVSQAISVVYGSSNYRVNEGGAAQVTVRLSTGSAGALQVPVTVSGGTAESGDYRVSGLSGGSLNFSQGSRSRSFTITALQDDDADDETLNLAFGTLPGGISLGSISRATITINDDDAATLTVSYGSANYRVNEGGAAQVTVRLSTAPTSALQVPVTVGGGIAESGDYRVSGLSGGALNFSQGSRYRSFTVTALQDDDADDETLNLAFGTLPRSISLGSVPRSTITINDDEIPPPLQLNVYYRSSRYAVTEGRSISVTVRLSADSDRALNIPIRATTLSAGGANYQLSGLTGGTLYLDPGERSRSFTFTALQDDDADDEQVRLGFGQLPANVVAGSRSAGTVTIEDDDLSPVLVKSVNGPPVFTEGEITSRTVNEQAPRTTPVGPPVTAVDPDGDPLTYYLSGVNASLFSLNSRTGQLQVWGQLDLEVKSTHLLNLSVSDGHGGIDSIVVAVNLSDMQEVTVASPSNQSVGLATGEEAFYLETPDGTAAIEFPADLINPPVFVRVESAAVDCGGQWPAGTEQALLTVQLYDSRGNIMRDADMEGAVAHLRFDALAVGGVEAAYSTHEDGGSQVYGYRVQEGSWSPQEFTFDVDELGVVALTVGDLSAPMCLVAVTHSVGAAQAPTLTGPESESGKSVGWASTPRGRPWSSEREPPDTSIPVVDVGGSGGPSGGYVTGGSMIAQAGMVGDLPWWPKFFLVLGTILLLGAVTWQFSLLVREKRMLNKTFTGPRKPLWEYILRA